MKTASRQSRGVTRCPGRASEWRVRWRAADGKLHCRYFRTYALAAKAYNKLKAEAQEGTWFPAAARRRVAFDEAMRDYRAALLSAQRADTWDKSRYERLRSEFGGELLDTITPARVEAFRDRLKASLAPATVNKHLQLLRAIFNRAVREGKAASNPVSRVRLERENNKVMRCLTEDEERRLFEALPERLAALVRVALHTGMRKGELLRLRWSDVDWPTNTIHVREAKSGEGRRLPMSSAVRQALRALRQTRPKIVALKDRSADEPSGYVFAAPEGGFMHDLNREWYPALKRAGLTDFRFHDLRHTFASRLAMAGVDLYRIQTLLGHKTPAMTLRYAHLLPDNLREAVERLSRVPGVKS